jgi:integrase
MHVVKLSSDGAPGLAVVDAAGVAVEPISRFLTFLEARGASPNTIRAYAYDLRRVWEVFDRLGVDWRAFDRRLAVELIVALNGRAASADVAEGVRRAGGGVRSAATINRTLVAMSSFCDWAVVAELIAAPNPMRINRQVNAFPVTERHRPFLEGVVRSRPSEWLIRMRSVHRLPRPLEDDQVDRLLGAVGCLRDRALMLLMLHGGLRPGEALGLHLEDIAYGRRRVAIRCRDDHPKGARGKSRVERVVDLHDGDTLDAVNAYVMRERPRGSGTPFLFLVGGRGGRRDEPLSYAALAKSFARAADRAGIRGPGVSAHALRHTHATRMWEAGMRELTLQRRLGHASPESTRLYTRVSDRTVLAEYRIAMGLAHDSTGPKSR